MRFFISWGGEKLDFFYSLGGSCTVSWGRLGGEVHRFGGGGGGGDFPCAPNLLGLISDCSYISSLEQL